MLVDRAGAGGGVLYSKAVEIAHSTALVLRTPSYIAVALIVDGVLPTNDKRRSLNARKVSVEVYYLMEEKAGQSTLSSRSS